MSRVGKNPILIPQGVECHLSNSILSAKGKNGNLSMNLSSEVKVSLENNIIMIQPNSQSKRSRMMWGTTRRLINNLVHGVSVGFTKKLEINGVGYRASVQGRNLILQLGYSHDIEFPIPIDIEIKAEKSTSLSIFGADLQRVGQVAAKIRDYRQPEPYKGKGVKYENEVIRRKEGKKK